MQKLGHLRAVITSSRVNAHATAWVARVGDRRGRGEHARHHAALSGTAQGHLGTSPRTSWDVRGRLRTSTLEALEIGDFREGETVLENEQLRTAITRAGLSLDELADIVQVDVKTVRRWLEGRTPYPRHRTRVASALETTAHALWPAAVPAPASSDALEPTTHDPGDVVAGYAYSSDPVAPKPAALLGAAVEQIEILIPNLASQSELVALLGARAADGCRISIIIEEPDAPGRTAARHRCDRGPRLARPGGPHPLPS